ncbi:uncharacterized protein J4E78_011017 [Alternaria triticimaculans]|uniref:uncharacterized protein n=1 Tax=Alternaria triticimaculans TaxID=297637 RepID=UPI0020C406D5|nr:uncharacterized protein J4E78_011017 [Alternaria triticimaculans]KAI4639129.1 hypothetical protein J4E78_011017 [Alternaria triticimaculans]
MHYIVAISLLLQVSMGLEQGNNMPDIVAPGRADRMFVKRAGKDYGKQTAPAAGIQNPSRIVYVGPTKGNELEKAHNRQASGCSAGGKSPCGEFPFSQKFSDKTAGPGEYDCDEWPPAMSQQLPFGDPNRLAPNSLRCMVADENQDIGRKLGRIVTSNGMVRDDFFDVDFDITGADQSKLAFCQPNPNPRGVCGSDGLQFELMEKTFASGKLSSYYNRNGDDNKYILTDTAYAELYQCGVEFTRDGDATIKDIKLSDWENKESTPAQCNLPNNNDSCDLQGLPNDLRVKRTGNFGTKLEFEYSPVQKGVNYFDWDSDMKGNGRGPWTGNDDTDPTAQPLRFCKVVDGSAPNTQSFECWFPCYKNADGKP